MTRKLKALALVAALIAMPVAASAHPCKSRAAVDKCASVCNPDGRTSITVSAGMGSLDGLTSSGEADLTGWGLSLAHPATNDLTLLAGWNHLDAEWDGLVNGWTPRDFDTDMFTVGVRFYIGK